MTEGKTIGNVNILDLRRTSEETIAGIGKVGNVNILLYSSATAPYISRLNLGNINVSIEAPKDAETRTVMSHLRLTPDSLQGSGEAGFYVVMGHVLVETGGNNASMEASLQNLAGLVVMGHVFCPESLCGIVQPKINQQMGQFIPYPDDAVLISSSLELTAGFLRELKRPTGFVVTGSVMATEDLGGLVAEKVDYLQVRGSIVCSAENAEIIRSKLRGGKSKLTVIPSGYRYREGDLSLDATTLESLHEAKLFCTGLVIFDFDVTPRAVEQGLVGLRSLGLIICPEALKDVLKTRLDMVEDRVIFYSGDLWVFDEDHTLHASRFEYSQGKATALVTGSLLIESDVEPAVLADRFHAVHNLGEIRCSPEQMGAIEARLGIHEGELESSAPSEEETETYDIGNANVLAL